MTTSPVWKLSKLGMLGRYCGLYGVFADVELIECSVTVKCSPAVSQVLRCAH